MMTLLSSLPERPDGPKREGKTGGTGDAPSKPARHAEIMADQALVFLEEPLARRLAVAWPTCGGDEDTWFEAAGIGAVQLADAHRLARALRINGICRDDGVTDSLALRYVAALVAEPLRKGTREKSRSRSRR